MLAHKQPRATEFCLRSVRKFYNNKIVVLENGSNELGSICKKYDCEYIHQPINYQKLTPESNYVSMSSLDDYRMLLDQYKYICDKCDTDWLIYLESDIVMRGYITKFPNENSAGGGNLHKFNTLGEFETGLINRHRRERGIPHKDKYIFSDCKILNRKILKDILKENWDKNINFFLKNCPKNKFLELKCLDAFVSYLFFINGHEIEDWDQVVEIYHAEDEYRLVFAPLVHQFKHFYS